MNIIPILPQTMDIIQILNGGVRPLISDMQNYYVYRGEDEHAEIIDQDEFVKFCSENQHMVPISIYYEM